MHGEEKKENKGKSGKEDPLRIQDLEQKMSDFLKETTEITNELQGLRTIVSNDDHNSSLERPPRSEQPNSFDITPRTL